MGEQGIPIYRTPEWRHVAELGLAATDPASGIDEAMQWAYDLGLGAGAEYARLEARSRRQHRQATGTHPAHYHGWSADG